MISRLARSLLSFCTMLFTAGVLLPVAARAATLAGTQTVDGEFKVDEIITYTVVLHNSSDSDQADNAGHEFLESVPAQLEFVSASATTGTISTSENSDDGSKLVQWDGAIAAGGSVTITITGRVRPATGGQILTAQGVLYFDANLDGENEASALTDDPGLPGSEDANTATVAFAQVSASQTVAGLFTAGGIVTYTVILTNNGSVTQPDNLADDEFSEILPASLSLESATATSGIAVATVLTRTVNWNGAIPAGGAVTISIRAKILGAPSPGAVIAAQGTVAYDADLEGTNGTTAPTYQPPLIEDPAPTTFAIRDFRDFAFVAAGKKPANFNVLANDLPSGTEPVLAVSATTDGQYGTVTVNDDGTLRYTPTAKIPSGGQDTFTYTVDAGLADSYTATVVVRDFAAAAGTYNGLLEPDERGKSFENSGLVRLTVGKTGSFTGTVTVAGKKFSASGKLDSLGVARFGRTADDDVLLKRTVPHGQPALPELRAAFRIPPTTDFEIATATLTEGGSRFASATADRAFYTSKKNPALPLLNLPLGLAGKYAVSFPALPEPNQGRDATRYPQGYGYGTLTLAPTGVATLRGTLADGTPFTYSNALSRTNAWPIFVPLYKAKGALTGPATFRGLSATDLDASNLAWFRPKDLKAARYQDGWPNPGILVNLAGSHFAVPPRGVVESLLTDVGPTAPTGNAAFTLRDGDLTEQIGLAVNVDPKNKVVFLSPPEGLLPKLSIASSGLVTGSFIHPVSGKKVTLRGVILQKAKRIDGYFLGPTQSGFLRVTPFSAE